MTSSIGVRIVLPAVIAIAGLVLMAVGDGGAAALGLLFVVVGGFIAAANLVSRLEQSDHWPHGAR
jgi:hypothetical protein